MKQITVVDNKDGVSPADVEVSMTFEGIRYNWDLTNENKAKLDKALAPWLSCADQHAVKGRASTNGSGNGDVRTWATEAGYDVSSRGRISADVQAAYDAAHA